jgi:hypothetical protein
VALNGVDLVRVYHRPGLWFKSSTMTGPPYHTYGTETDITAHVVIRLCFCFSVAFSSPCPSQDYLR